MIHLDTSFLVDALAAPRQSAAALRAALDRGEPITFSALVLFEWRRGPRTGAELASQESLVPYGQAVPFGPAEAALAADLSRRVPRPRGRDIDLAIAACAIIHGAKLWTLNPKDFRDIPGLALY